MRALEALYEAQKIAFGPFVFQTVVTLLDLKVLETIEKERKNGITIEELSTRLGISVYGLTVLVEMAEAANVLERNELGHLALTRVGFAFLSDRMTQVNLHFANKVCYKGMFDLTEAIKDGTPAGLKTLGSWPTVYEGLSSLPDDVKKAWFDFDHFYSDNAFSDALNIIFQKDPHRIFDIGGNTGKWAIACAKHSPEVSVTILDLPKQIGLAKDNINMLPGVRDRVQYFAIDMLDQTSEIPAGADVYWMSQFLDCFGEQEIENILLKVRKNISKNADVYIMETFIDDQQFPAASFSLIATSLYFTTIANGNSKMYSKSVMKYIINKAGFDTVNEYRPGSPGYHTILHCKPKP